MEIERYGRNIESVTLEELSQLSDEQVKELLKECITTYRREREKPELFTCDICFDEYSIDETFQNICGHRYCLNCWRENILVQLNLSGEHIHCLGCPELVDIKDITYHRLIPNIEKYNMYTNRVTRKTFHANICCCPKCHKEMFSYSKGKVICTDPSCKYVFCIQCEESWHEGRTCQEYREFKERENINEQEFRKWQQKNTKQCPRCKNAIEKNKGCNHMTCKCGYEFCWLCMQPYTRNHFRNNTTGCVQFDANSGPY